MHIKVGDRFTTRHKTNAIWVVESVDPDFAHRQIAYRLLTRDSVNNCLSGRCSASILETDYQFLLDPNDLMKEIL